MKLGLLAERGRDLLFYEVVLEFEFMGFDYVEVLIFRIFLVRGKGLLGVRID